MGKWIRRIIMLVLLCVFIFSAGSAGVIIYQYRQGEEAYEQVAKQYVQVQNTDQTAGGSAASGEGTGTNGTPEHHVLAPLIVDFESFQKVNPDIIGWLYCEDTVINYPVLHGADNDMYLRHLYDHTYNTAGSIFVESLNRGGFQDANTIIYGHNMHNDTMFGTLDEWGKQEYFDQHPIFWLLTPEQDYKVELLGGYTTSAYSDTYLIFSEPGPDVEQWLAERLANSVIESPVTQEEGARYVLFSTCSYVFDNARFVLHGKLTPVDSAGGVLKTE